jgi:hypothetical protein
MDDEYTAWSGMADDSAAWSGMEPGWVFNFVETMPDEVYTPIDFVETMPDEVYTPPPSSYGTGAGLPGEEAAGQSQGGTGGTGNVVPTAAPSAPSGISGFLKSMFVDAAGKPNPMGILGAMALLTALNRGQSGAQTVGYQGGVPRYTATRQQTQYATDPNRRPGSSARQYFTPVQYVRKAAEGGLMNLAGGKYLSGATDGMADKIPATIENKQPARLSHGEFVIPADVVSHLGNGNSEAGAQRLYDMMDRIRKARTGTTKQGKQINPGKYTPA